MGMSSSERSDCEDIIHTAAIAAGAACAAPIPGSDILILTPIQVTMIVKLGDVFGVSFSDSAAQGLATSALAGQVGKAIATALLKFIPGVGSLVGSSVAFGITEKIGWDYAEKFSRERGKRYN